MSDPLYTPSRPWPAACTAAVHGVTAALEGFGYILRVSPDHGPGVLAWPSLPDRLRRLLPQLFQPARQGASATAEEDAAVLVALAAGPMLRLDQATDHACRLLVQVLDAYGYERKIGLPALIAAVLPLVRAEARPDVTEHAACLAARLGPFLARGGAVFSLSTLGALAENTGAVLELIDRGVLVPARPLSGQAPAYRVPDPELLAGLGKTPSSPIHHPRPAAPGL